MKDFPEFGKTPAPDSSCCGPGDYEPPAGAVIMDEDELDLSIHRSTPDLETFVPAGLDDALLRCGIDVDPVKPVRVAKPALPDYDLSGLPGSSGSGHSGTPVQNGRFVEIGQFLQRPPATHWLIRDFVCQDITMVFFGEPSSGKSLVLIDMACHIATGRDWCGHKTTEGLVLYICGEGQHGLSKRFMAWFQHYGETPRNLHISTIPAALTDAADITALIKDIADNLPEKPVLVLLDTLNRNFGPGDESATADMTKAVTGMDRIRTSTQAAMGVAHHCSKGDKNNARGSGVLKGATDVEYLIEKDQDTNIVTMRYSKPPKDFDPPPALAWIIQKQGTPWADDEGQPVDSVILNPVDVAPAREKGSAALGENQQVALDLLRSLMADHAKNLTDAGIDPDQAQVSFKDWYSAMKGAGFSRARCSDSKSSLLRRGLIKPEGELYVRPA